MPPTATISAGARLSVQWVSDYPTFLALRDEWNSVAGRRSVFLRHEWFDAAWQWRRLSPDIRLAIACVRQENRLTGICPLLIRSEGSAPLSRRVIEFLTVPDNQLCDLIVDKPARQDVIESLAAELSRRRSEWDRMRLAYLPDESVAASPDFVQALKRHGIAVEVTPSGSNPYVAIASDWNAYYATRGRSLKKTVNLAANRLGKAGNVRIEWLTADTAGTLPAAAAIDAGIAISAASWKRTTGNSLDNTGPQAFIRRLAELALAEGWLSLWLLKLDERPIASEWQLIFGDRVHALRSDFVEEFDELSPGTHLNKHLLENLFDRGLQRYLLGPGDNAYKKRWTEVAEPLHQLDAYSPSPRGRLVAAWETRLKPRLRTLKSRMNNQKKGSNR